MSIALALDIADAVADSINGSGILDAPTVAVRQLFVNKDLPDLQDLCVYVVPASVSTENDTRGSFVEAHEIHVAVIKSCPAGTDAQIAPLMYLAERIRRHLVRRGMSDCLPSEVSQVQHYNPEAMEKRNQFFSIIKITYEASVPVT